MRAALISAAVLLAMTGSVFAQEYVEFKSQQDRFSIVFPAQPKLTETTYFALMIAWAQEVERFAEQVQVDYEAVASFYEEIGFFPPVKYFPGVIGGHCVMPNIELLKERYSSRLLDAIEWSNELRAAEGDRPQPR